MVVVAYGGVVQLAAGSYILNANARVDSARRTASARGASCQSDSTSHGRNGKLCSVLAHFTGAQHLNGPSPRRQLLRSTPKEPLFHLANLFEALSYDKYNFGGFKVEQTLFRQSFSC